MENLSLEGLTPEQVSKLKTTIENFKRQSELTKEKETSKIYDKRIYEIYVTEVIPVNGDPGYWPCNRISINVHVDVPVPCADVSPLIIEKIKNGEFEIESASLIGVETEKILEKSNIIDIANHCDGFLMKGIKINDKKTGRVEPNWENGFIRDLQGQVEKAYYIGNDIFDDVLSSIIDDWGTHGCKLIE